MFPIQLLLLFLVVFFHICHSAQQRSKVADETLPSDAELGMNELKKTMGSPKALAEALESLKDPQIAKEVRDLMSDPKFKEEMKKYTDDPAFKLAMNKAAEGVEKLSSDPVRLKQLEAEIFAK